MVDFKDGFINGRKEIVIKYNGEDTKFYANEVSYFTTQKLSLEADREDKHYIGLLVASSITDEKNNKFTYDEVMSLKKEYAKQFFDAVIEINSIRGPEKN
jgi:hypothetical protein